MLRARQCTCRPCASTTFAMALTCRYGKVVEVPQSEETPFYPRSPYAVAKLYGFWITKNYRWALTHQASLSWPPKDVVKFLSQATCWSMCMRGTFAQPAPCSTGLA